jgi:hypothetical protein
MDDLTSIDDAIIRTRRARASTLNVIERKLQEIESLRSAYASSADYLDQLLDRRMEVAVQALTTPHPTQGPPLEPPYSTP